MQGTLTFLGTGTSMGVPTIACACAVCTSADTRDKRLRPSVLVRWPCPEGTERTEKPMKARKGLLPFPEESGPCGRAVLIDTGPDFRQQALTAGLKRVDAVFYTHSHADHIFGLDDLRPLSYLMHRESGPIPLHTDPETRTVLERIYNYTFAEDAKYPNRARVQLNDLRDGEPVAVHEVRFVPVPVMHGNLPIMGYRFGNAAYFTDVSSIPESSFALLEGLEVLVLSALRHTPHPSHANVEQAVRWAKRIGARDTWFTHISHELGHAETNARMPKGMALAYDGLTVPVTLA